MKIPLSPIRMRWRRFTGPAVVLLAAAVAVASQLARGNSCGHDFDFHLASWFDCLNSWRHGILYPHWAPSANWGAGEPRFVFYSPLTWMLGAALGLAMPWQFVPVALTFLLLAGTGLATRALALEALDDGAATLAGCIALFSGYAFFTAYERSAFAELAGGSWMPLVMLYLLRERNLVRPEDGEVASHPFAKGANGWGTGAVAGLAWRRALDGSAAPLALTVAGAWLSNPTVGVMACYLLAAFALASALLSRWWAPVLRAAVGAVLGMGLTAIYLLPAFWEQRWVDIHQVTEYPGQVLENNWLFSVHPGPEMELHDQVLHTASTIAVVMITITLGGLLASWLRGRLPGEPRQWIPLALVPAAVLLLQFPFSRPLWNLLPELRFLQFPWRWLVVLEAPMAIFVAAALWPRESGRGWRRVAVAAACTAAFLAWTAFAEKQLFQSCYEEDTVPAMLAVYRSGQGFIGTNEYEPIGADNGLIARGLPAFCLAGDPAVVLGVVPADADPDEPVPVWESGQGSCDATLNWQVDEPEHKRLRAAVPRAGFLILRLRSYPAWRIEVGGRPVASLPRRNDGLIAVPVSPGEIVLTVDWTATPDVLAGRWLSALAVLALTGLCFLERKLSRPRLS